MQTADTIRKALRGVRDPELNLNIIDLGLVYEITISDPRLIRIIVHFIYPNVDEKVTDEVRVEAVRSLSEVCGMASLISVYHSLKDDAGRVVRESDRVLSAFCDARSPVGGGIAPLNRKQRLKARRHWRAYFHGEAGTEKLVDVTKRVPLIFFLPGGGHAGRRSENVTLLDIAPTVLDSLGIRVPDYMEGRSLLKPVADRGKIFSIRQSLGGAPPKYHSGKVAIIDCDRWALMDLKSEEIKKGLVPSHSKPCGVASPTDHKIRTVVRERLAAGE